MCRTEKTGWGRARYPILAWLGIFGGEGKKKGLKIIEGAGWPNSGRVLGIQNMEIQIQLGRVLGSREYWGRYGECLGELGNVG